MDLTARSFLNLQLSFRGAERQPPSVLCLALTLSAVMKEKNDSGAHGQSMSTQQRLAAVICDFHNAPGMLSRWRLDDDKEKAVLHLLVGTTAKSRSLIASHLDYHKWAHCVFTSELIRSSRWLVGAAPRNVKAHLKSLLTVDAHIQQKFLKNIIATFVQQTKKVKPGTRPRYRPSQQEWDRLVDYTCIMQGVVAEAASLFQEEKDKLQEIKDAVFQAFLSRCGRVMGKIMSEMSCVRDYYQEALAAVETALPNFSVRHLSIWTELVQPVSLQDAVTSVDVEETEEVTAEAQFREVRSKIRSLCRMKDG